MSTGKTRLVVSTFVPHFLMHALVASLPLFVPLWLVEFDVSRATIGTAMGALFVFYGGTSIPVGILADRYGSVPFLELYLFGTAVGAVVLGLTTTFVGLVLALIGVGLASGLYHPPAFRLISRQSYASSSLFAYHNIGGNLGLGIGPLITAVFLAFVDWRTAMLVAGGVLLVTGVLFTRYGPEESTVVDSKASESRSEFTGRLKALFTVGFVFVLSIYLLQGTYHRGATVFIPDYLQAVATVGSLELFGREIPPSRWVYSVMLMVGVGGQLLGGYLDDRFRTTPLIAVQLLGTAGLLLLLGRVTGLTLFAAIAIFGIAISFLAPILQNLVARHTSESERGLGYGFTSAGGTAAGGFLGASLAGWLATVGSYPRMFSTLALVPLAAVGLVVIYVFHYSDRDEFPGRR